MTDAELSAAIAGAARGVWADTINRDSATLGFRHGKWVLWDGIGDSSAIPPCWAAAILLHELERIMRGWAWVVGADGDGKYELTTSHEQAVCDATVKLRELLEQT